MSDTLQEIRDAINNFDVDHARELLRDAMKSPNAETYYLASMVAFDENQKKNFLEKALEIDPFHEEAYRALNGAQTQAKAASETTPPADEPITPPEAKEPVSASSEESKGTAQLEPTPGLGSIETVRTTAFHDAPTHASRIRKVLPARQKLDIVESKPGSVKVEYDGVEGWVEMSSKLIALHSDVLSLEEHDQALAPAPDKHPATHEPQQRPIAAQPSPVPDYIPASAAVKPRRRT
jgi:hypothetical protein